MNVMENLKAMQTEKDIVVEMNGNGNGNGVPNLDKEMNKIQLMRALLEKHHPSFQELDDLTLRRFLRARDQNIEKACCMYLKYRKWRHTFVPNGYISANEIPNELAQNKVLMQGTDKIGRPIIVVRGAKHFKNKANPDEFKRFVVFCFDKLCSRLPPGEEKFVVIGDVEGWGYRNSDLPAYLGALSILQDYYPERLGKLFFVHVPYIFMTAWKIIYPFIDNKTKKKITFVEDKLLKKTLLQDIDESQLPQIYGGELPLVAIEDA